MPSLEKSIADAIEGLLSDGWPEDSVGLAMVGAGLGLLVRWDADVEVDAALFRLFAKTRLDRIGPDMKQ